MSLAVLGGFGGTEQGAGAWDTCRFGTTASLPLTLSFTDALNHSHTVVLQSESDRGDIIFPCRSSVCWRGDSEYQTELPPRCNVALCSFSYVEGSYFPPVPHGILVRSRGFFAPQITPELWEGLRSGSRPKATPFRLGPPLRVKIVGARGLRDADWLPGAGKSDPYCVCQIPNKPLSRFQTPVVSSTACPTWDHRAEVLDFVAGEALTFTVYDKDPTGAGDVLGTATLPSRQFARRGFKGELRLGGAGEGAAAYIRVVVEPVRPPWGCLPCC